MSSENVDLTPIGDVSDAAVEVSTPPEADSIEVAQDSKDNSTDEDAEYKAAMAKLRGEKAEKQTKHKKDMEEIEAGDTKPKADIDTEAPNKPVDDVKDKEVPQVWKLKVNGSEVEYDASNTEQVQRDVQKGLAADHKFQEASAMTKKAENFIRALKEDPESVLGHPSLGINLREFAENFLYKQIQRESDPETYQRTQEQAELEQYRKAEATRKQQAEQQQREQMKQQYRQDYERQFTEALETGGVPKTDWTVQRTALYMKQAISKGYKHIAPKDVIHMVKQDWVNAQQQMFQHLDGDKLIETVGQEVADKIRKANLARMSQAKAAKKAEAPTPSKEPERRFSSTEEMLRHLQGQ